MKNRRSVSAEPHTSYAQKKMKAKTGGGETTTPVITAYFISRYWSFRAELCASVVLEYPALLGYFRDTWSAHNKISRRWEFPPSRNFVLFCSCFFILRRMGENNALAHHTSTYFHTRRVSIELNCFRSPTLAGAPFGSHCRYSVSCPYQWSSLQPRQRKLPLYIRMRVYVDPACPLRVSFGGDSHNQGGVLYTVIGGMRYSN